MTELQAIKLTTPVLLVLAEKHIDLYSRRIESESPSVDKGYATQLLELWREIKDKGDVKLLGIKHLTEIQDALDSGDYDYILEGQCAST